MLKWMVLLAAVYSAPAWAAKAGVIELDGLRMEIPETEFIKARPAAVAGGEGWYIYEPEPGGKREFGFPVRGYMRGFESGKGCALAVGFWKTSSGDTEKLSKDVEASLLAHKMVKSRTVNAEGAVFEYYEGPKAYASLDRLRKGGEHYALSLQVALKSCPDSVSRFKARPYGVEQGS